MKVEVKPRLSGMAGVVELMPVTPRLDLSRRKPGQQGLNGRLKRPASVVPGQTGSRQASFATAAFNAVFKRAVKHSPGSLNVAAASDSEDLSICLVPSSSEGCVSKRAMHISRFTSPLEPIPRAINQQMRGSAPKRGFSFFSRGGFRSFSPTGQALPYGGNEQPVVKCRMHTPRLPTWTYSYWQAATLLLLLLIRDGVLPQVLCTHVVLFESVSTGASSRHDPG
jgi:hypothetical protein